MVVSLPVDSIGHDGFSCLPVVGPIAHVIQWVLACLAVVEVLQ